MFPIVSMASNISSLSSTPFTGIKDSGDALISERGKCLDNDHHVQKYVEVLKACSNRVSSRSSTAETCEQETIDLMHAIDHCVGHKAFDKIK